MLKRNLTTIRCNIRPATRKHYLSLKDEVKKIAHGLDAAQISSSLNISKNLELVINMDNRIKFLIEIMEIDFSFSHVFKKATEIKPQLSEFRDSITGLNIVAPIADNCSSVSINVSTQEINKSGTLRELAIPSSSSLINFLHSPTSQWIYDRANPGVYRYNVHENVTPYRLIPNIKPTFILFSERFSEIQSIISKQSSFQYEDLLGGLVDRDNGDIDREKLLEFSCFKQLGFCVRLTNYHGLPKLFVHESESILDDTIDSIQSARVMGGPSSLIENKFGFSGDCWSEVKAMGSSFAKSTVLGQVTSIPTTNNSKLVSKPPSIVE